MTLLHTTELVSKKVNTSYLERHNGTGRNRNGRKGRKTYCFSKDWDVHEAVTYFTTYINDGHIRVPYCPGASDDFCVPPGFFS